jgi:hypothetical protein
MSPVSSEQFLQLCLSSPLATRLPRGGGGGGGGVAWCKMSPDVRSASRTSFSFRKMSDISVECACTTETSSRKLTGLSRRSSRLSGSLHCCPYVRVRMDGSNGCWLAISPYPCSHTGATSAAQDHLNIARKQSPHSSRAYIYILVMRALFSQFILRIITRRTCPAHTG